MEIFKKKHRFLPFLYTRLKAMKEGTLLTKRGTRYGYPSQNLLKNLGETLTEYNENLCAEDMDDAWMDEFCVHLTQKTIRKNTVATYLKTLKSTLRSLCKTIKIFFPAEGFSYGWEVTTKVFTSVLEIEAMCKIDLSARPALARTRDAYVVQCYTGLRFSDLIRLLQDPKQALVDDRFFRVRTQKTDKVVVIPIANKVRVIMEQRAWKFEKFSIQLYNRSLKVVAAEAGITQMVELSYTSQGKKVRELRAKNELMSSHTARRSFATNAFLAGIPTLKIRQITGHTTESSFLAYIRSDGMESAQTILNDPFFTN